MRSMRAFVVVIAVLAAVSGAAAADKPVPPAKAVKQAEANLKRLMKEGEDRPSVYEARMELIEALRSMDSCGVNDRIDAELAIISAWMERSPVPVRLKQQVVYNEMGRAAQTRASCTEDAAQYMAGHEAALKAFARAREIAKQNHDALNEAVVLYNAAMSAEAIDDLPQAIAFMEQACAIDLEYALDDNYREDYPELVRLKDAKSGAQTPPEAIERHLAALAEDPVHFSFKATHGEKLRYRSRMHEVSLVNGERQERNMDLQYSNVISVKDGLVTFSTQPEESKIDGRDVKALLAETAPGDLTAESLITHLLAQPLSYTVKTDGEFVGAAGLDELRRLVLAKIDETFVAPGADAQRANARRMIEQVMSDAVINQQVASEWTMAVSWWIGANLDIGDWYAIDIDAPQAVMPGSALKYKYRFKVNRRIACTAADARKNCVELIIESSPDRQQFADYLINFTNMMAGKQPRKQVKWYRERLAEDAELLERHVLVVDPNTLKTYNQLKTKTTYMPAGERGAHPKIEMETSQSELLPTAPAVKPAPVKPTRNVTPPRTKTA